MKEMIFTPHAPNPSGTYSQAIKSGNTMYLSGQISNITDNFREEAKQVFANLSEVAKAAGGDLDHIVKLTIFLMDLANFSIVNEVMTELFKTPYPARSTFQVAKLPKGANIEVEAIMVI